MKEFTNGCNNHELVHDIQRKTYQNTTWSNLAEPLTQTNQHMGMGRVFDPGFVIYVLCVLAVMLYQGNIG